ncbi:alpha-endosulfine-like protein [Cricetulus griseus]|uniref:Alpha-endosulfine n=1 Tax=Cricetulus griseus TaxID=10029 RepID=A0A061IQN2_CRIGR|nr:alpha-endosulfine-like protein [Cricetulus griseus]
MSQKQEEENPAEETGEEKQDTQEKEGILPERAEEAKLKAKYPSLGQKPGGSDFLMKRLQKGQKYFDSGDYNMAKAKMKNKQLPSAGPDKNLVTGDHIPTPQDLPQRKSSLVTSKLAGTKKLSEDFEPDVAHGHGGRNQSISFAGLERGSGTQNALASASCTIPWRRWHTTIVSALRRPGKAGKREIEERNRTESVEKRESEEETETETF